MAHLGYVQIDTINVIERCHHHILWSRIPDYHRRHLHQAQTQDRSVFEYWTHALSYVPTADRRYFLADMKRHRDTPRPGVPAAELKRIAALIRREGTISIRDIADDVLVDKDHAWASRKPSKRTLQHGFYTGLLAISERVGMLKTYELAARHFVDQPGLKPATERQTTGYVLDRALRAQGVVNLDTICHLDAPRKPAIQALIDSRVRGRQLVPVAIEGSTVAHYASPATLDGPTTARAPMVHILSPFDPLIIQRRRLILFFGYDHRFEAYVPKDRRVMGYFTLPVLVGDTVVAALDLKADRQQNKLLIQSWHWISPDTSLKPLIEQALHRFEAFQFQR